MKKNIHKRTTAFIIATAMMGRFFCYDANGIDFPFANISSFFSTMFVDAAAYTCTLSDLESGTVNTESQTITVGNAEQMIRLSNIDPEEYQYYTITITNIGSDIELTGKDSQSRSFLGLGSKDNPFCGTISITQGCKDYTIVLNRSLFQCVDTQARFLYGEDSFLRLKGNTENNYPLLAEKVTGNTATPWTIYSEGDFGGIIGELDISSYAKLDVKCMGDQQLSDIYRSKASGNTGFFCNIMNENSKLEILNGSDAVFTYNVPDVLNFSVESTAASAGAFVGTMAQGSELIVPENSGKITGTVKGKTAGGGIAGEGSESTITIANDGCIESSCNVEGAVAGGIWGSYECTSESDFLPKIKVSGTVGNTSLTTDAGGIAGICTFSSEDSFEFILPDNESEKYFSKCTVSGMTNSGGAFGTLNNQCKGMTICGSVETSSVTGTYAGGIVGSYKSGNDLQRKLVLGGDTALEVKSGTVSGGLIAIVSDLSYVKIKDCTVTMTSSEGGFIGESGEIMLNLCGQNRFSGTIVNGGIIGKMTDGALRLEGKTDFSNCTVSGAQIVKSRENAVVYAEPKWEFYRGKSSSTSDIGDYGEVIRTDGFNELFIFNPTVHTVTVHRFNRESISSGLDFSALAVSMQAQQSGNVLKLSNTVSPSDDITLTDNIDMTGTGVTGLMRDNGALDAYSGTFDGGNHTITIKAGEIYGKRDASDPSGDGSGQIYNHSYGGLFAEISGATVKNLTVDGEFCYNLNSPDNNQFISVITAYAEGNCTFNNVTSSAKITSSGNANGKKYYAGGFIGFSNSETLSFTSCIWNHNSSADSITNSVTLKGDEDYAIGGFVGISSCSANITVKSCKVKGKITDYCNKANGITGGLIAYIKNGSILSIDGLTVNADILTKATATSGGLLGWDWENVDLTVKNAEISGSRLISQSSSFGGLVYAGSGYWHVVKDDSSDESSGIYFKENNTVTGKTGSGIVSGLIVCRGNGFREGKCLFLSLDKDSYIIEKDAVNLTLPSDGNYFDEICGNSIKDNFSNCNGVVSVETEDGKIDIKKCNIYKNQIAGKTYKNSKTRYYYNIDSIISNNSGLKDTNDIDSAEKLVLWSLYHYAESNIRNHFMTKASNVTATKTKVSGEIDLTEYSYYPVCVSEDIDIVNATITFANDKIQSAENLNRKPNDSAQQHYMMQYGLLIDFCSTTEKSVTLSVHDSKLNGSFGNDGTYSGALVCRKIEGQTSSDGLNIYQAGVDINGLALDGIKPVTKNDMPLLIKSIPNYSNLIFNNVYTTDSYTVNKKTSISAGSLIGIVGTGNKTASTTSNLMLTFTNMGLDSRKGTEITEPLYGTYGTIFENSLFVEQFIYPNDSTTCGGQYTFNKNDNYQTYGKEISNSGEKGGRNPDEQYSYFDVSDPVTYGSVISNKDDGFFTDSFLRYVGTAEDFNNYHEIDINQKVYNFEGCGTYSDPYIIDRGEELEQLTDYLNGFRKNGFELNFDRENLANSNMEEHSIHTDDNSHHIKYTITGGKWVTTESGENLNDAEIQNKIKQYLRNAYYQVTDDITLGQNGKFYGIGGSEVNAEGNSFCGVIAGKKPDESGNYPTITVNRPSTAQNQYGGLIKYSNGSVVKDLNIKFESNDQNDKIIIKSDKIPDELKEANENWTSRTPACQVFFGGVIGYVIGGDNIIDNVKVNQPPVKVDGTNVKNSGYDYMANVGGYVGLIGGSITEGGGVIFRNIEDSDHKFFVENSSGESIDTRENVKTSNDTLKGNQISEKGNQYFYWNPYIGRVLDGFALSENCSIENTDKNYKINKLSGDDGQKIQFVMNSDNLSTVTVTSSEQLWILSAIVNSGAGGMINNFKTSKYNNKSYAYYWGRVRNGSYDHIGSAVGDDPAKNDDLFWGGKIENGSTDGKYAYLINKYASDKSCASHLTCNTCSFKLVFGDTDNSVAFDMTDYGNGFRGIGTTFEDNAKSAVQQRCMPIHGITGNNSSVTLNRCAYEYSDDETGWWTQALGLFPLFYFNQNTDINIENLTIKGNVDIYYRQTDKFKDYSDEPFETNSNLFYDPVTYTGECASGGFAGITANGSISSDKNFIIKNLTLDGLSVRGGKYSGGIFAVVGSSTRITNKSTIASISLINNNSTMPFKLDSCHMKSIKIQGSYASGGFIGVYANKKDALNAACTAFQAGSNSRMLTITGDTTIKGTENNQCEIGWIKDACYDAYVLLKFATKKIDTTNNLKNICKTTNFSGAGAMVGMCCCQITVDIGKDADGNNIYPFNDSDRSNCNLEYIYLYDPPFAYNCDYGLGSVVGMIPSNSGAMTINNVVAKNIRTELVIDPAYKGMHKKYNEETGKAFYIAPSTGGITGYIKVVQTITSTRIYDSQIYNGAYTGLYVGSCAEALTIKNDCYAENSIVYTENSNAYDGPPRAGILVGGSGAAKTMTFGPGISIKDCTVVTDGRSGILMGGAKTDTYTFNITDVSIENSKAVTTRNGVNEDEIKIPFIGENTDPTYESAAVNTTKKTHVCGAGALLGLSYASSYTDFGGAKIYAYNVLIKDSLVGYYCGDTDLSSENIMTADISENTVGAIKDKDNLYSYKYLENNPSLYKECTGAYLGLLTGGMKNDQDFKVVGLCVKGGYYPYELNGNSNLAVNTTGAANQFVIFSDYDLNQDNTTLTPWKIASGDPTKNRPYLTINPVLKMKITQNSEKLLTSDGVSMTARDHIIGEIDTLNGYKYVSEDVKKFAPGGKYERNLTTYKKAKANEGIDSKYTGSDFPVLLIDKNNPDDVTDLINSYISMLTNCPHSTTLPASSVSVRTYRLYITKNELYFKSWDYLNNINSDSNPSLTFTKTSTDPLSWSTIPNVYDNTYEQFTMIDIQYASKGNYHLLIPVIVQKVQEFSFYASVLNGTEYYFDAYGDNTNAVLTKNGERITARLDYNYYGDSDYWQSLIDNGNNMLFSYDKELNLGVAALPPDTKLKLIDVQNGGYAYQADWQTNDLKFSTFRSLADGSLWQSDYITSLLPLAAVQEDSTVTDKTYESRPSPLTNVYTEVTKANATICVYGDEPKYYKFNSELNPTEIKDGDQIVGYKFEPAYKICLTGDNVFRTEPETENKYITESYFLTIYFPEDASAIVNNAISFNKNSFSSTPDNSGIPSQIINLKPANSSNYIFAMSQQGKSGISVQNVNKDNCYVSGKLFDTDNTIFTYDQIVQNKNQSNEDISTLNGNVCIHLEEKLKYSDDTSRKYAESADVGVYHQFSVSPNYINEYDEQIASEYPNGLTYGYTLKFCDKEGNQIGDSQTGDGTVSGNGVKNIVISSGNISEMLKSGDYITVIADVILDYSKGELMSAQFPMKPHTSLRPGIKYSADYQLRFTENGSNVYNETKMDKTLFAIDQINNANLVYYAYDDINIGNGVGNIGQLGINPSDPDLNFNLVYTESDYDYSNIADKSEVKQIRYELVLMQKLQNNTYAAVDDINNYLSDISLSPANAGSALEGVQDSGDRFRYTFTREIMAEEINTSLDKTVITYHVKTGDEYTNPENDFEQNNRFYANYKVGLTVMLLDNEGKPIANSESKDYIIYTNARIYPHFIGNATK